MVTLCESGACAQHRICSDHRPLSLRCAAAELFAVELPSESHVQKH